MAEEDAVHGEIHRRIELIRFGPGDGTGFVHRTEGQAPIENAISCRLKKVCGRPYFSNIHDGNNVVDWFSNTDTAVHSYTIQPGFYTLQQLVSILNINMTAQGGGETWDISYDEPTDTFQFDTTGGGAANQFNMLFLSGANVDRSIASTLGFPTNVDSGLVNTYDSTLPTTLSLPCVLLLSKALGGGRKHPTADTDGSHQEICWHIPLAAESPSPTVSYEADSYDSERLGFQGARTIGPDIDIAFLAGPAYGLNGVTADPIPNNGSLLIELEFDILNRWK